MKALSLLLSALLTAAPAAAVCVCEPVSCCCDGTPVKPECLKAVKSLEDVDSHGTSFDVPVWLDLGHEPILVAPVAGETPRFPEDVARGSPPLRVPCPLLL